MIPSVSVEAARRQSFGAMFNPNSRDKTMADVLLNGKLQMSPHPEWALPKNLMWTEDPFSDRNWRAQLHMLRWMDPLRRRADSGNRQAASAWIRYAKSWVESNLDPRNSAREAWMDMVDGIRALELCFALPFVSDFDPVALNWLVPAIEAHAVWLMDGRNLGHSNHALHQHQGLFVCGAVLCDEEMMRLAERRMVELFRSQYDSQGVNAEGAIYYHMANANWWDVARQRLEVERRDIDDSFQLLNAAAVALAHSTKPDGTFVSIGDTDGGNARAIGHPATKWVSTAGADGEPPADTVRLYDAGYFYARSGWGEQERDFKDETFLSLSFGSPKRVHGHNDGLSMTYSSMGHEWVTDPGKFQYGSSAMRDYCLSRTAHSLPYILKENTTKRQSLNVYVKNFHHQCMTLHSWTMGIRVHEFLDALYIRYPVSTQLCLTILTRMKNALQFRIGSVVKRLRRMRSQAVSNSHRLRAGLRLFCSPGLVLNRNSLLVLNRRSQDGYQPVGKSENLHQLLDSRRLVSISVLLRSLRQVPKVSFLRWKPCAIKYLG